MCDFIGYSVTWIGYFGPWRTFTSGSLRHAAREKQVAGERVLIRSCRLHALTSGWQFCVLSATHAVGQRSSCLICKSVFDRLAAPLKITYVCVCIYLYFSRSDGAFFSWSQKSTREAIKFLIGSENVAERARVSWAITQNVIECARASLHALTYTRWQRWMSERKSGGAAAYVNEWANEAVLHLFAGRRARILIATAWMLSALFSAPIMFLFKEQLVQGESLLLFITCVVVKKNYVSPNKIILGSGSKKCMDLSSLTFILNIILD